MFAEDALRLLNKSTFWAEDDYAPGQGQASVVTRWYGEPPDIFTPAPYLVVFSEKLITIDSENSRTQPAVQIMMKRGSAGLALDVERLER